LIDSVNARACRASTCIDPDADLRENIKHTCAPTQNDYAGAVTIDNLCGPGSSTYTSSLSHWQISTEACLIGFFLHMLVYQTVQASTAIKIHSIVWLLVSLVLVANTITTAIPA